MKFIIYESSSCLDLSSGGYGMLSGKWSLWLKSWIAIQLELSMTKKTSQGAYSTYAAPKDPSNQVEHE